MLLSWITFLPVSLPWFPGSTGRDFLLQERHFLFWERGSLKRCSLEALQDQDLLLLLVGALGFSKAPRDSFGCSRRCINNWIERMQEHTHTGKNNRQKEKNIRKSPHSIISPECFVFKSFPCRTVSCLTTNFLFGCSFCTFASWREGSGFQTWAFRCEVPPPPWTPTESSRQQLDG